MEGGIKDRNLRKARYELLHSLNAKKVGRVVKRRKLTAPLYLLYHISIHLHAAAEELSSVRNSVAYCIYLRYRFKYSFILICKKGKNLIYTLSVVFYRETQFLLLSSCNSMGYISHLHPDSLHKALGKKRKIIIAPHIQKLILKRGAAAIEN